MEMSDTGGRHPIAQGLVSTDLSTRSGLLLLCAWMYPSLGKKVGPFRNPFFFSCFTPFGRYTLISCPVGAIGNYKKTTPKWVNRALLTVQVPTLEDLDSVPSLVTTQYLDFPPLSSENSHQGQQRLHLPRKDTGTKKTPTVVPTLLHSVQSKKVNKMWL